MSRSNEVGKTATKVATRAGRLLSVTYHNTKVVTLADDGTITLDTGGYRTNTTKLRMNQAAEQFKLGYHVYQEKGDWWVKTDGKIVRFDTNVMILAYHFKG